MNNKLKIHTINIDHWFESKQDVELYRRTQGINTRPAVLSSPSYLDDLMTEDQLIQFLHIPSISNAKNHNNVIDNLIRMRDLPRIKICNTLLFPRKAILQWIEENTVKI